MPAYVFGSREDHIVPWQSAYASTGILRGPLRFVLGASGHIAGVINPPAKKRRHYWAQDAIHTHADIPGDPNAWLADAGRREGRSEEHTSELQSLMRISYAVYG